MSVALVPESLSRSFCCLSLNTYTRTKTLKCTSTMKSIWITALALTVGVLGSPLDAAAPHLQTEKRQFENESFVLPDLLHAIQSQTGAIGQFRALPPDLLSITQ